MKILKLFFLQFLLFFSYSALSQSNPSQGEVKKQYHYTFTGELTPGAKQTLEENLNALKFVDSAKIKYKNESQSGELFLQSTEVISNSEDQKGFDLIALKKLISSYNLTPIQLTVTQ